MTETRDQLDPGQRLREKIQHAEQQLSELPEGVASKRREDLKEEIRVAKRSLKRFLGES